jgi:hypothetical protein
MLRAPLALRTGETRRAVESGGVEAVRLRAFLRGERLGRRRGRGAFWACGLGFGFLVLVVGRESG